MVCPLVNRMVQRGNHRRLPDPCVLSAREHVLAGTVLYDATGIRPHLHFQGTLRRKDILSDMATMTVIYVITFAGIALTRQSREPMMERLYALRTQWQIAGMAISIALLPPVVEELAFRHFVLGISPFVHIAGSPLSRPFFTYAHAGVFIHPSSYVTVFAAGLALAIARLRSNGLLLPMMLHAQRLCLRCVDRRSARSTWPAPPT